MMTRTKLDAINELNALQRQIASNRKTAATTNKRETAELCDKLLPSLKARAAAPLDEIPTLPEREALTFAHTSGNFPCLTRTAPFTQAELDALEIPAFLRRDPTTNRLAA
jgi:hypothetical protein